MRQPCVYILASGRLGTLYVGVTSDLVRRLHEHRAGKSGFTNRYRVYALVRYELFADMPAAIVREKQLKRWHRDWKITLIESEDRDWIDLAVTLALEPLTVRARCDGP